MRTITSIFLATLLALTSTTPGFADEPTPEAPQAPPTKKARAEAKALVKEATKLYNVQQYDKAAELYQQAYLLDPRPAYLYATAQSQRLHGDCDKALLSYQTYLRTNPAEGERDKAQKNVERCEQDLREKEAAVTVEQVKPPEDLPPPPPPPKPDPSELELERPVAAPKPPGKSYVLGHLMVGLGVGAVAGGVYFFRDGRTAIHDHNAAPTYDAYVAGRAGIDDAKQKQTLGMAVMGGGAALIAGGVLYYVLHSRGGDEKPPPVSASVSAQQTTVTFTRTF